MSDTDLPKQECHSTAHNENTGTYHFYIVLPSVPQNAGKHCCVVKSNSIYDIEFWYAIMDPF